MSRDTDVIVVGAGHNGLITAAYLAQAGYRVSVFERRHIVGGAVATEELFPGYQVDLGGSAHILIRLTPILDELKLHDYGLEYLELDPLFFSPFPDGDAIFIYRDLDRTVAHLDERYPGQGKAYRRFVDDWRDFSFSVRDMFLSSPSPFALGRKMIGGRSTQLPWKRALQSILQPYGDVAASYFEDEKLRAMLVWMAAQSGPPPTEPLTGPFLLWHPLYHEGGIARPRGGSGMLTQALARHIEAHGGRVYVGTPVEEILVERGRATGVRVAGGIHTARAVVAATHAAETFGRLLPAAHRPPESAHLRIGNGFGAVVRLALSGPVRYTASPGDDARTALQLLCRDTAQLHRAYGAYLSGSLPPIPPSWR